MKNLVLDNIIFGLQRSGGISRFWYEIVSRLIADDEFFGASFLEPKNSEKNIFRQKIVIPEDKKRYQFQFPSMIMQFFPVGIGSSFVFHSSYFRHATGKDVKNVLTVYDCIYERFGGHSIGAMFHKIRTWALRHADIVICISNSTAKDVMHFYPFVDKDKIRVVYLAAGDEFFGMKDIPEKISINGKSVNTKSYLLYVGKRNGYKNFQALLRAMEILKKKNAVLPNILVVGGEKKMAAGDVSLIKKIDIGDKIFRAESCSAADLNLYYNCAKVYVCTSLHEGFGLPILEAFKAGCPVITANNSSLSEVASDAALLFDAEDPDSLAVQIECISDIVRADKYRKAGAERAKLFSWDKTYQETKQVYKSLGVG